MSSETILLRKGLRNSAFWSNRLTFKWGVYVPFYLDTGVLMQSQYWPRERLDALARANIEKTLQHAGVFPLWRERFKHSGIDLARIDSDDIQKLPVLTKKDFNGSTPEAYTDPRLVDSSITDHTSGSTGKPFRFLHDRGFIVSSYGFCERAYRTIGNGERFTLVAMRAHNRPGLALGHYHFFFVRGYNSIEYRLPELLKVLEQYSRGVVLWGFSSNILALSRICASSEIILPSLRGVAFTGESMSEEERGNIEKIFRVKAFNQYAAGELGRLGFECEHQRLHLNEERVYAEVVDERGNILPHDAPGRFIFTIFDNPVMPFIRYAVGDRGMIHSSPCPCGRSLRTILVQGRDMQLLRFGNDRAVSVLEVLAGMGRYPHAVVQFQIHRTGEYAFTIQVVPGKDFASMREAMTSMLKRVTHPSAVFSWKIVTHIPEGANGKALYFIDSWSAESKRV